MSAGIMEISVLVFACAICIIWAAYGMMRKTAPDENASRIPPLFRMLRGGIFFFGAEAGDMLVNLFPGKSLKIKETIGKADAALEAKDVYGAQILFFLFMAGFGAIVVFSLPVSLTVRLFFIAVFGLIGWIYPGMYLQKLAEKRTGEIMRHLPFAIDLISSSMNAGLDFGAAVRYLLSTGENDVLRKEFSLFLKEIELGKTRADAMRDMQNRIGITEFTRFASAITYGMDSGSSIIDVMQIQAQEMRRVKYARAEQQASKAPVKMIIPMAIFIFPSMFIMIFVPIFLRLKDSGVLSMFGK